MGSTVSIGCITFNHALFIRQCLDGFMMQQCDFDFEILIHDDASTDGTIEIIKEYQEKYPNIIKPIFQTENQYSKGVRGIMARFNFPRAQGKYIALCEGDDYWTDPLKLQKQVDFMEANPEFGACFTNALVKNSIDNTEYAYNNYYHLKEGKVPDELIFKYGGGIYPTATLMFRNQFDLVFLSKNLNMSGDELLLYFLCEKSQVYFMDTVTAVYNRNSQGVFSSLLSKTEKLVKYRKNEIKGYNEIIPFFSPQNQVYLKRKRKEKVLYVLQHSSGIWNQIKYFRYLTFSEMKKIIKTRIKWVVKN